MLAKLAIKHRVEPHEIEECFLNRERGFLMDSRERHRTDPPTQWFIAETHASRRLKVCFMRYADGTLEIKTAFEPNDIEERIYERHA